MDNFKFYESQSRIFLHNVWLKACFFISVSLIIIIITIIIINIHCHCHCLCHSVCLWFCLWFCHYRCHHRHHHHHHQEVSSFLPVAPHRLNSWLNNRYYTFQAFPCIGFASYERARSRLGLLPPWIFAYEDKPGDGLNLWTAYLCCA